MRPLPDRSPRFPLQTVNAIVFVADSQPERRRGQPGVPRARAGDLRALGRRDTEILLVLQANKQRPPERRA